MLTSLCPGSAWKRYAPLHLPSEDAALKVPTRQEIWHLFEQDLRLQEQTLISTQVRPYQRRLEENPRDAEALNSLAMLLARNG